MDLPPDSDLSKALNQNGYNTHYDLLNLSEEDIVTLEVIDDANNKTPLNKGYRSLVRIFQAYVFQTKFDPSDLGNIKEE